MKVLDMKKVITTGSQILTTADKYTEDECMEGGILDTTKLGVIKDLQKITAVSKMASERGFSEGENVLLNFSRYANKTQGKNSLKDSMDEYYETNVSFQIPSITINGVDNLLLDYGDVSLKVVEFDWIDEESSEELTELTLS